jgi:DNA-directed RNA polymerase subunit N (RpoN/RPB10)
MIKSLEKFWFDENTKCAKLATKNVRMRNVHARVGLSEGLTRFARRRMIITTRNDIDKKNVVTS